MPLKKAKRPTPEGAERDNTARRPMPRRAAAPVPPCPGTVCITRSVRHSGSRPRAHTAMAVAADSHRLPPTPPAGSCPALRRAERHGIAFISSAAILYSISAAASSGMISPPQTGRATVCIKSLAEFRGRSREINFNHFRRRRVRRRKYFSRSGVSNCPPWRTTEARSGVQVPLSKKAEPSSTS